jgi:hypothetical protein
MPVEKNRRRHRRISWINPVRISWEELGEPRYALTKCLDISETGLRIESPRPMRAGSTVLIASERIRFTGSAIVRNMVRNGSKYLVGLQFTKAILGDTIAKLEGPPIGTLLIENFNRIDQKV